MKRKFRTAVVTMALGPKAKAIARLTHPIMRAYARRIRSDFVVIDKSLIKAGHPKFEKFQIYDLLAAYDRILYLDNDIIVMPACPNVFSRVPRAKLGAFFDSEVRNNDADIPQWRDEEISYFQEKYGNIKWQSRYFNTGVMVLSQSHRKIMDHRRSLHRGKRFIDQTQINYDFQKSRAGHFDLGPSFNYLVALNGSKRQFDDRFRHHILHYAGFDQFYKSRSLLRRIREDVKLAYPRPARARRGSVR